MIYFQVLCRKYIS